MSWGTYQTVPKTLAEHTGALIGPLCLAVEKINEGGDGGGIHSDLEAMPDMLEKLPPPAIAAAVLPHIECDGSNLHLTLRLLAQCCAVHVFHLEKKEETQYAL